MTNLTYSLTVAKYDKINVQGEHKNVAPPTTFVDISAIHEDFCMKFYTTVKQNFMIPDGE